MINIHYFSCLLNHSFAFSIYQTLSSENKNDVTSVLILHSSHLKCQQGTPITALMPPTSNNYRAKTIRIILNFVSMTATNIIISLSQSIDFQSIKEWNYIQI